MANIHKLILNITVVAVFFIFGGSCIAAEALDVAIIEIGAFEKSGYEWIKIYNNTNENIDLEGWKFIEGFSISKPKGTKHSLKEYNDGGYILPPKSEAVICQNPDNFLAQYKNYSSLIIDSSWGSLKEDGERIQILDPEGNTIEDFTYLPCPEYSLKRIDFFLIDYSSNNWQENKEHENITVEAGQEKTYSPADEQENINMGPKSLLWGLSPQTQTVIINEILPNPEGPDNEKEFIELKNIGKLSVNLNGWTLNDNSKRSYVINNKDYRSTFIRPGGIFLIYRDKSKIALNNSSGDEIKLYNPIGEMVDGIMYSTKAPEQESYALNQNENWFWTTDPTPGEENKISKKNQKPIPVIEYPKEAEVNGAINFDASDSYDVDGDKIFFTWDFGDGHSSTLINPDHSYKKRGVYKVKLSVFDDSDSSSMYASINITENTNDNIDEIKGGGDKTIEIFNYGYYAENMPDEMQDVRIKINAGEIEKYEIGTLVEVTGVVAVEPGILGKQIFYLNGAQVYMYKSDFPELRAGNKIMVAGKLTQSRGERRIKIKKAGDIVLLEEAKELDIPHIYIEEVNEAFSGSLIKINGEIVERKGNSFWIDDDTDELKIYINKYTGITLDKFSNGQEVEVTGIIGKTNDGFRLLPRYESDIKFGNILGEAAHGAEETERSIRQPADKTTKNIYNKYLLITLLGLSIITGNLIWRHRK